MQCSIYCTKMSSIKRTLICKLANYSSVLQKFTFFHTQLICSIFYFSWPHNIHQILLYNKNRNKTNFSCLEFRRVVLNQNRRGIKHFQIWFKKEKRNPWRKILYFFLLSVSFTVLLACFYPWVLKICFQVHNRLKSVPEETKEGRTGGKNTVSGKTLTVSPPWKNDVCKYKIVPPRNTQWLMVRRGKLHHQEMSKLYQIQTFSSKWLSL